MAIMTSFRRPIPEMAMANQGGVEVGEARIF